MPDETPILKQYRAIKADHPDAILMFQIGDFYEMLERDAEIAARECELTLTTKALGKVGRLPLAGVPQHSVEPYIARLVRRGYHVAICDQTEDASKAKGLVSRAVTRLVTPGTYESTDGRANNFLAAFHLESAAKPRKASEWAISFCDCLTGELYTSSGILTRARPDLLVLAARFRPSEVLLADGVEEGWESFFQGALPGIHVSRVPAWQFAPSFAEEVIRAQFRVESLAPLGLAASGSGANPEGIAVAAALSYLKDTQKTAPVHVTQVRRVDLSDTMTLDPATLLHLEVSDSPTGDTEATLRRLLDQAVTAMGSRLIGRRLSAPLKNADRLRERLDRVEAFFADGILRADTREIMKSVHDFERIAGKLALGTITPREARGLANSLESAGRLRAALTHELLLSLAGEIDELPEVVAIIRERLVDEPPIQIGDGPLFREGYSADLDGLRRSSRDSREWIAGLQASERERTGIASLKVGFNTVFGYYIEVTKAHTEKIPANYLRKQTLTSAERYFTEELKYHEEIVLRANERIQEKETLLFAQLRSDLLEFLPRLQATAAAVAEIDLTAAFADVAERRGFVRPNLLDGDEPLVRIEGGRHPVVEALLTGEESFVPNTTDLGRRQKLMLLTGPNMAGKSTYIRQVAVIALMAQIGSFVPAKSCAMTLFDAVYTRIGASDRLARGLSTFMVEMIEAARILRGATNRSLVILDEIGRGTSTYDGLAIAWAIVEALAARGSLALFATHYHELTSLAKSVPGVFNATVAVREWRDRIHFLHEIRPGAADRSYGIQVAALAGVPAPVLARAKDILSNLEVGELRSSVLAIDGQTQLTFWNETPAPPPPIAAGDAEALRALREADLDGLSPRDAFALLATMKEKLS